MNIQNIQIMRGQLAATGVKSGSGIGKDSAERSASLPEKSSPETQVKTVSDGSSVMDVYYPPLFPMGHTQGIYETLAKSDGSSGADTADTKNTNAEESKTSNTESVARQQTVSSKDATVNVSVPVAGDAISPGSVLDLEI